MDINTAKASQRARLGILQCRRDAEIDNVSIRAS